MKYFYVLFFLFVFSNSFAQLNWEDAIFYQQVGTNFNAVSARNQIIYLIDEDAEEIYTIENGDTDLLYTTTDGYLGVNGVFFSFHYPNSNIIDLSDSSVIFQPTNGVSNYVSVRDEIIAFHNFYGDWISLNGGEAIELEEIVGVNKGFMIKNNHVFDYMAASGDTTIYEYDNTGSLLGTNVLEDIYVRFVTFLDDIQLKKQEIAGVNKVYLDYGLGDGWQEIDNAVFQGKDYHRFALSYYGDEDNICITCVNYDTGDVLQIYTEEGVLKTSQVAFPKFSIYPNPSNGLISIDRSKNLKKVTVFDTVGNQIMQIYSNTIDLTKYKKGVYFVLIESDSRSQVNKIIIQ